MRARAPLQSMMARSKGVGCRGARKAVSHPRPQLRTGGLSRAQVNSKERSKVTVARCGLKAEDTKVMLCKVSGNDRAVSGGPKQDQRWKLGKVIAATVAGTNAMKGELHLSNASLKGSGLDDHMTDVAGDFASMANLMRNFVVFSSNDGSATGQTECRPSRCEAI